MLSNENCQISFCANSNKLGFEPIEPLNVYIILKTKKKVLACFNVNISYICLAIFNSEKNQWLWVIVRSNLIVFVYISLQVVGIDKISVPDEKELVQVESVDKKDVAEVFILEFVPRKAL